MTTGAHRGRKTAWPSPVRLGTPLVQSFSGLAGDRG